MLILELCVNGEGGALGTEQQPTLRRSCAKYTLYFLRIRALLHLCLHCVMTKRSHHSLLSFCVCHLRLQARGFSSAQALFCLKIIVACYPSPPQPVRIHFDIMRLQLELYIIQNLKANNPTHLNQTNPTITNPTQTKPKPILSYTTQQNPTPPNATQS